MRLLYSSTVKIFLDHLNVAPLYLFRKLLPVVSLGDNQLPNPLGRGRILVDFAVQTNFNTKTKRENPGIEMAVLKTYCLVNY